MTTLVISYSSLDTVNNKFHGLLEQSHLDEFVITSNRLTLKNDVHWILGIGDEVEPVRGMR